MRNYLLVLLFIFNTSISQTTQKNYTISGFISDETNGETIVGVNIFSDSLKVGTSSNNYGFYSLTLPEGRHEIVYSYMGYNTEKPK